MQHKWLWPLIIAHRGASMIAPENTLAALKQAKVLGAQCVECDVQLTKDEIAVILHDARLNRTSNGRGLLSQKTYHAVQKLDAGSWFSTQFQGEPIPTLREWLMCAAQLRLFLNLELKVFRKTRATALAEKLVEAVRCYWPSDLPAPLISSSSQCVLSEVKRLAPHLPLGLIVDHRKISAKKAATLSQWGIFSIHQPYQLMQKSYVQRLHDNGLFGAAYTVNDATQLQALRAAGVDSVFSDDHKLFAL